MKNGMKERIIIIIVLILFGWYVVSIIANKTKKRDPDILTFWVAPNQTQGLFWGKVVNDWNKSGLGLKVEVRSIPASNSSEEAILTSIVSNTNPDMCTNIFSGFGAQLSSLEAIYPLSDFDGYEELIKTRDMETIMKHWELKGKNYIFPIYCNPFLNWWRWDKLQENGFDKIPITYSDLYELAEKVTIPFKQYAIFAVQGRDWWDRWADYIAYYYAAGNGAPYIKDNKAVLDNKYSREVLEFFKKCLDNKWTMTGNIKDAFFKGQVFGKVHGPWDILVAEQLYPEVLKSVKIGPILVPDSHKGPIYTYADSKGMVIFKSCPNKEEAWKFMKWVFSQDKYSKLWVEQTSMPPARGDLMKNPMFADYYKKHAIAAQYADYVSRAVPTAFITDTLDVQTAMTNLVIEPLEYKTTTVDEAIKKLTVKIDDILEKNKL
jgi:multiple sugar transport system substrate-binding protein